MSTRKPRLSRHGHTRPSPFQPVPPSALAMPRRERRWCSTPKADARALDVATTPVQTGTAHDPLLIADDPHRSVIVQPHFAAVHCESAVMYHASSHGPSRTALRQRASALMHRLFSHTLVYFAPSPCISAVAPLAPSVTPYSSAVKQELSADQPDNSAGIPSDVAHESGHSAADPLTFAVAPHFSAHDPLHSADAAAAPPRRHGFTTEARPCTTGRWQRSRPSIESKSF